MYGPSDESLISIPSIYEVLEEIEKISSMREKKSYKKKTHSKTKEFPLVCRCGQKFDINTKTNDVYEYIEQNNVIIKKKFESENMSDVFSSKFYPKEDLIKLIRESKVEVSVVLTKGITDETRQ